LNKQRECQFKEDFSLSPHPFHYINLCSFFWRIYNKPDYISQACFVLLRVGQCFFYRFSHRSGGMTYEFGKCLAVIEQVVFRYSNIPASKCLSESLRNV